MADGILGHKSNYEPLKMEAARWHQLVTHTIAARHLRYPAIERRPSNGFVRQATVLLILCFQIGTLLQGVRNNNGLISCSGRHLKSHVMLTYSESFIIVHIRHCCTAWRRPESLRCYRAGGVGGVVGSHASDAPIASDDPGHTPAEGKTDCFLFCSSTCTVSIPASVTHLRSKRLIYLGVS